MMHQGSRAFAAVFLLAAWTSAPAPAGSLPAVQEHRLANGIRILMTERPGTGAVHARLFIRAGRADTGQLPPSAADLLARCLFGPPLPEDLGQAPPLDGLLKHEEGSHEALRQEKQRSDRGARDIANPDLDSLEALHGPLFQDLDARARAVEAWDPLAALGATRRAIQAEVDSMSLALDLPASSLDPWLRLERERLRILQLARFARERERLQRPDPRGAEDIHARQAWALLLGAAMAGQPYARAMDPPGPEVDALLWSEVRSWAETVVVPSRMLLVLVGDVSQDALLPLLEATLGSLGREAPTPSSDAPPRDMGGARRLQVVLDGPPEFFISWRIPHLGHPDLPAIGMLASLLGGLPQSRLAAQLTEAGGPAEGYGIRSGFPGGRHPGLLVLNATPREGRAMGEIEQFVLSECARLQRQGPGEAETRMARARMTAGQDECQDDAAQLAQVLGAATCQGGDWRLAFRHPEAGESVADQIQQAARKYLVASQSTVAMLEADPVQHPRDAQEQRLVKVLTGLLARSLDTAPAEAITREALRQLRLLPRTERDRTLQLLESQVKE